VRRERARCHVKAVEGHGKHGLCLDSDHTARRPDPPGPASASWWDLL
jgi:hypothetical protein